RGLSATAFPPPHFAKYAVLREALQWGKDLSLFAFSLHIFERIGILKKILPDAILGLSQLGITIRDGNYAQNLRQIGVACRTNQQPIDLCRTAFAAASLLGGDA